MQRSCYKLIKTKYCWVQYSSGKMEKWENYVWKWYVYKTYIHNKLYKSTLWSRLTNILHNISLAFQNFLSLRLRVKRHLYTNLYTQTYTHKPAHRHTKYFTGIMYFSFESSFHRAINFRRNFFTYFIAVRVAI